PQGTITITANGTLEAFWEYVRPFDTVSLAISNPPGCGTITLNGTAYSGPGTVMLLDLGNYSLTQAPCALEDFSGWTVSNGTALQILGGNLYLSGNGTITANYIASSGAVTLLFQVYPAYCPGGGILFRGAGYTNESEISVTPGTSYPIQQLPCANYGFEEFETTPGIAITGGTVTATQAGTITEVNYALTLVTVVTVPASCGGVRWNGAGYDGTFANGTVLNVSAGSTASVYAVSCPGYYPTGLSGSGGVRVSGTQVTVQGSGSIVVTSQPGTAQVWVGFLTSPGGCGEILFGGVPYRDSQYTYVGPGTNWTLSELPCGGMGFVGWATTGLGVSVIGSSAIVSGPGTIKAIFHSLATVYLYTLPSSCGSVELGGTNYSNGATVEVPEGFAVPIRAFGCAGYGFAGWQNTSDSILSNGTLVLEGSAIVTALFGRLHFELTMLVSPGTCGGVVLGGGEYFNDSTVELLIGAYSVTPEPCAGYILTGWNSSAGITVENGTTVNVGATGWVLFLFGPVPPSVTVASASSSYTNTPVAFVAAVAVEVAPYTYTYRWGFGDGTTAVTPANFTQHAYAHPGRYVVTLSVKDPYGRVATSNTSVLVTSPPLVTNFSFPILEVGVLLILVAAIGAAILITRRRGAPPPGGPPGMIGAAPPSEAIAAGALTGNLQEGSSIMLDAPSEEPSNPEEAR
ncbi:MAG: PKD domain-containing protein, partial [Thermoplasmata archaeon]